MAIQTADQLRSLTIYSVYLRNHGRWNTFSSLKEDLPRIQSMEFDAIWLMPIHPIGQLNRKGDLGCPYSIQDYEAINPEYGTEEEFKDLIDTAHDLGLKVLIDVVYNHTSHDSVLRATHPSFFLHDASDEIICKEPDWSDVIDLDYGNPELWPFLIRALTHWSALGVDGYRCDVASLVPVSFWKAAREAVSLINPDTIWLAESVHTAFLKRMQEQGYPASDDATLYEVFDLLYDYDIHPQFEGFVKKELGLPEFIRAVKNQDSLYPGHYIKLRFIENHDQPRLSFYRDQMADKVAFTVMSYLLKGATLVYAGQETTDTHTPSLFELDPIGFDHIIPNYVELLTKLNRLVKDPIFQSLEVSYQVVEDELLIISYGADEIVAVLPFGEQSVKVDLGLKGTYKEVLFDALPEAFPVIGADYPYIFRKIT